MTALCIVSTLFLDPFAQPYMLLSSRIWIHIQLSFVITYFRIRSSLRWGHPRPSSGAPTRDRLARPACIGMCGIRCRHDAALDAGH